MEIQRDVHAASFDIRVQGILMQQTVEFHIESQDLQSSRIIAFSDALGGAFLHLVFIVSEDALHRMSRFYDRNHLRVIFSVIFTMDSVWASSLSRCDSVSEIHCLNSAFCCRVWSFLTLWLKLFPMAASSFRRRMNSSMNSSREASRCLTIIGLFRRQLLRYSLICLQVVVLNLLSNAAYSAAVKRTAAMRVLFKISFPILFPFHFFKQSSFRFHCREFRA